jgi:hypothetical protein
MSIKYPEDKMLLEEMFPRAGSPVFWFGEGLRENTPCPAIVNVDSNHARSLSLTIFTVNGPMIKDGVKHLDMQASVNDRRDNGGWAWNRKPEAKLEEIK